MGEISAPPKLKKFNYVNRKFKNFSRMKFLLFLSHNFLSDCGGMGEAEVDPEISDRCNRCLLRKTKKKSALAAQANFRIFVLLVYSHYILLYFSPKAPNCGILNSGGSPRASYPLPRKNFTPPLYL